jgi:hypothetical protein
VKTAWGPRRASLAMDATAAQPPRPARQSERQRGAQVDPHMKVLTTILHERQKAKLGESELAEREQAALGAMGDTVRGYAVVYGAAAGALVAGVIRGANPIAYRNRMRFWTWVGPSCCWGAYQGMQSGARAATLELLNLPDSSLAMGLVS